MSQGGQGKFISHNSTSRYIRTDFAAGKVDEFGFAYNVAHPTYTQSWSRLGHKNMFMSIRRTGY